MSFPLIASNNGNSTLATSINNTTTTITLAAGTGSKFASPVGGQYFTLTLNDALTGQLYEICYCTARSGDTLTVLRGQEGTAAQFFIAGDIAFDGVTAGTIEAFAGFTTGYFATDTGSGTNIAISLAGITSLAGLIGIPVTVTLANHPVTLTTLTVNSLAPTNIFTPNGDIPSAYSGEFAYGYLTGLEYYNGAGGDTFTFIYNGTNFIIQAFANKSMELAILNLASNYGNNIFYTTTAGSGTFTFTVPPDFRYLGATIIITGAGAGATGCNSVDYISGSGAGAGGTLIAGLAPQGYPNVKVDYTVGAPGVGGIGAAVGAAGGATTAVLTYMIGMSSYTTTYHAYGGSPGTINLVGASYYVGGGVGGSAAGSGVQIQGGDGSDGTSNALFSQGTGGTSYWGGPSRAGAGSVSETVTPPSVAPGSGGSGIYDPNSVGANYQGGNGAPGLFMVIY